MNPKNITNIKKNNYEKKINSLKKKLKKLEVIEKNLKQDIKNKEDKLIRSYADFQNYQKRKEKELQTEKIKIKNNYISEIIDILDLLKNAYNDKNSKKGLKLIILNIEKILEKEQVKYIDCIGKSFDHNLHHAVSTIEKDNCENGIVVEEVKKGYLMGNTLLRPAQVIVANKKENSKMR